MDVEDQEALFQLHSYPHLPLYYVQSPSTLSHANSTADFGRTNALESAYHSPLRSDNTTNVTNHRFILSHYSSSRGSNNSFLQEKKIIYDLQSQKGTGVDNGDEKRRLSVGDLVKGDEFEEGEEEEEEEVFNERESGCWKYLSFGTSSSCLWIALQLTWRILVSLSVALLVFYIATKPPQPKLSIKTAGIRQFGLGEGVDATGIPTKILTSNCSVDLIIDNKSKVFGLHVNPPLMEMFFGHLPIAISRGPKLYAGSHGSTGFQLYVGTRNTPMYGAGRSMQDMLESGKGLTLVIRLSLRSSFRVVWNLITPKFHHQAECFLVLNKDYDKKHRTQAYNSTCFVTS